MTLNKPVVGMAATPHSDGYWLVASDGGIFTFGDAQFYGSTGAIALNKPVVGMAATPDRLRLLAGGLRRRDLRLRDAQFYGSMGGKPLNQPIVGMAATPDGHGYWLVAADGGIFAFGDALFYGSTGAITLNQPIVGMTATPNGKGYWFTAADGGVFAFGDATSTARWATSPRAAPIVAMTADAKGNGYWFTNNNGAVTAFGTAAYWGSAPQVLNRPVVGMAEADATGQVDAGRHTRRAPTATTSPGTSAAPCRPRPTPSAWWRSNGQSFGAVNPCLASEAAWAAGGLNLYIFLTYGTTASSDDPACTTMANSGACNYGFNAALDAFDEAETAGVDTSVAWWLDVEGPTLYWSSNTADNARAGSRAPSTGCTTTASTASASTPAPATGTQSWALPAGRPLLDGLVDGHRPRRLRPGRPVGGPGRSCPPDRSSWPSSPTATTGHSTATTPAEAA